MEDETLINGGDSNKDEALESLKRNGISGNDQEVAELNRKIESLEEENSGLLQENEDQRDRIKFLDDSVRVLKISHSGLNKRVEELQTEIDRSTVLLKEAEEDKNALRSIAARAAELESEIVRLQHDLVSTMTERDETVVELGELKNALRKLEQGCKEKDVAVESLEKEKVLMMKKIEEEDVVLQKLKKTNETDKVEYEKRISELVEELANSRSDLGRVKGVLENLEKQNAELEIRLQESLKEKERVESELRALMNSTEEKEKTIIQLQKDLGVLTSALATTSSKLQDSINEKEQVERLKIDLEKTIEDLSEKYEIQGKLLNQAEGKIAEVESKLIESTSAFEMNRQGLKEALELKEEDIAMLTKSRESEIAELHKCVEKLNADVEASSLEKTQLGESIHLLNQEKSILAKRVMELQEELKVGTKKTMTSDETHESAFFTDRSLEFSVGGQEGNEVAGMEKGGGVEDGRVVRFPWPAAAASTGTIAAAAFMVYLKYAGRGK